MNDTTINGIPIRSAYGAILLEGAVAALLAPPATKPYIVNASRLQDGERIVGKSSSGASLTRVAARDVTLTFAITADGYEQSAARLDAFCEALMEGEIALTVPQLPYRVFHLRYLSCTTFSHVRGELLKFAIRFREPNPKNRS
ncbi:MAG: hypothetical protein HDS14_06345 [Bacteroides sp.]|nr:hypothetical protein [Bacteroides sp.]